MTKLKEVKTHFEQVPVDVVKKIAIVDPVQDRKGGDNRPKLPKRKLRAGFIETAPTPMELSNNASVSCEAAASQETDGNLSASIPPEITGEV